MSETQRIVSAAQATETITDARGRGIDVRRLSRMETMRLMRGWGTAANVEIWLGNAILAATARAIDGVPLPVPASADMAERAADKLGDEGLQAIGDWLQGALPPATDERDAAKN